MTWRLVALTYPPRFTVEAVALVDLESRRLEILQTAGAEPIPMSPTAELLIRDKGLTDLMDLVGAEIANTRCAPSEVQGDYPDRDRALTAADRMLAEAQGWTEARPDIPADLFQLVEDLEARFRQYQNQIDSVLREYRSSLRAARSLLRRDIVLPERVPHPDPGIGYDDLLRELSSGSSPELESLDLAAELTNRLRDAAIPTVDVLAATPAITIERLLEDSESMSAVERALTARGLSLAPTPKLASLRLSKTVMASLGELGIKTTSALLKAPVDTLVEGLGPGNLAEVIEKSEARGLRGTWADSVDRLGLPPDVREEVYASGLDTVAKVLHYAALDAGRRGTNGPNIRKLLRSLRASGYLPVRRARPVPSPSTLALQPDVDIPSGKPYTAVAAMTPRPVKDAGAREADVGTRRAKPDGSRTATRSPREKRNTTETTRPPQTRQASGVPKDEGSRLEGILKVWHGTYGFIETADGRRFFLHQTTVRHSLSRDPRVGAKFTFTVQRSDRGAHPAAVDADEVATTDASHPEVPTPRVPLVVPKVVGERLPRAKELLEAAGFEAGNVESVDGKWIVWQENWQVRGQRPSPGKVTTLRRVDLDVAKEP